MIRVGWRDYFKQKLAQPSKFVSVGIEVNNAGVTVSAFRKNGDQLTWSLQESLSQSLDNEHWYRNLRKLVERHNLANTPCYVSLSTDQYQILQVDRPQVDADEVAQALTWTVKDLVPHDGQLVVDYFDPPKQVSGANKVSVVAVAQERIETLCNGIRKAGLNLQSVTVAEMTAVSVIGNSEEAVMVLLQQAGDELSVCIAKQNQLYFVRRLRGYENLSTFTEQELQLGVGDNLSVEIQRSLDYFESQLRQAPVKKIVLAVQSHYPQALANVLNELTLMPVEPVQLNINNPQQFNLFDGHFVSVAAAVTSITEHALIESEHAA